jgi:DNA invertase Pin-like site-specific DNA recombinase
MRYAVYLRVSTEGQADDGQGLLIQEAACREWLRSRRDRLVEVCSDAGRSGGLDVGHRPGLARALALVAADRADGVLVHRLDRLARDLVLQEQLLAELHRRGKGLASCDPTEDASLVHSPDDPTRALVRRMLGSIAQYEREVIRLRLMAGRARKALDGGYAGGAPPFGFAAVRGQLAAVPDEQRTLRLMRRLAAEGVSYRLIAGELERREMAPRSGGKWHPATIRGIVQRDKNRRPAKRNGVEGAAALEEVSA